MHEMSIVTGILDIAEEQARAADARVINAIEIDVGRLAGVEIPALEFCFDVARRHTLASGAALVIHDIPGRGHCPDCDRKVALEVHTAVCPDCGEGLVEILQGRELRVRSLNVD